MLSLIVAHTLNQVIGKNNDMPWHLPEDLKHFKTITMGAPIIMGRKTFESIGKPLPGRRNIVITQDRNWHHEGVDVVHSLDDLVHGSSFKEGFIIGGAKIYQQTLPLVDKLYITLIHETIEGDTFFPKVDFENDFEVTNKTEILTSEKSGLKYQFIEAKRKSHD